MATEPDSTPNEWLLVFSQVPWSEACVTAWDAHASRFFSTRLGLAAPMEPRAERTAGGVVDLILVVAPDGAAPGSRRLSGRARTDSDLSSAEQAARTGPAEGLVLVARRCDAVWLVERQGSDDRLGWMLATILSSACLGPLLDRGGPLLLGPKSARERLASMT